MQKARFQKSTIWFVLFELLGETWGIRFSDIQEILETKEITPIPKAPPFIAGLTHNRGKIISIIDLGLLVGEDQKESKEIRIIHLRSPQIDIGLLIKSKVSSALLPKELETGSVDVKEFCGKGNIILGKSIIRNGTTKIKVLEADQLIESLVEYPLH